MQRRRGNLLDDTQGAAVIEFAILTPVFVLLMTGMLAYGIYFGTAHSLQQLAADAVRVSLAGLTTQESRDLVESYIHNNASA
ncbi:TadE/TadG family type IV pilus assembly protein [Devosia sp. 63-57]|uniref:TadE/TadG family type IV pilus assembly protein n=1 Tax=Devosia sp. 63-57 TaxID=1895751 RepID=UPI000AEFBB2D|nr:TadE/TadG family type IV pilus assembly protein [Devosia sp. 63-57]